MCSLARITPVSRGHLIQCKNESPSSRPMKGEVGVLQGFLTTPLGQVDALLSGGLLSEGSNAPMGSPTSTQCDSGCFRAAFAPPDSAWGPMENWCQHSPPWSFSLVLDEVSH